MSLPDLAINQYFIVPWAQPGQNSYRNPLWLAIVILNKDRLVQFKLSVLTSLVMMALLVSLPTVETLAVNKLSLVRS